MKAVVMAGGEGTRLRPLTSNQPKPMVPIVGKPCMEHIVELLKLHGFEDIIVTTAFLPQAIRSYFGDGESLGVDIGYSVEESPLGTAGSVRLAAGRLDDTFLVISGDALCDVDLTSLVEFHREKKASVTIGLKAVENPLEFGIVVTDEEGRVERFLEKPSWGQVFSDTINTGIYVLEPEVLQHIPTDRPYDFSKELFPLLLEMGRPIYGHVFDGYWQDIGNLDQFRQANIDALEERVRLNIAGIRIRGNVWLGDGVDLDDLDAIEGPAYIGSYCRIGRGARVGPHVVLATSVTVRERGRVVRSMVDSSTYIGRSSRGRGRDHRARLRPARARSRPRGRCDRRRGEDRLRERDPPRRPDLPVQGSRDRLAAAREPHLGVARHHAALRQAGRRRDGQRRSHARRRGAPRCRARQRARARRARRGEPGRPGGVPDDQARDDLRAVVDRESTSPTCA